MPSTVSASSAARTSSSVKLASNSRMNGPIAQARVVVLGLAEQQRAAPLDVAQVDVVAERRAADPAAAVDRQHDLGLGVVPARDRVQADRRARAHRRHRLALGEDLGVGPDADLEVLRPQPLGDAAPPWPPRPPRCPGTMSRRSRRSARRCAPRTASAFAGSPRARSSITRSSIERAKVTPQALIACRSQGASSRRPSPRARERPTISASVPRERPSAVRSQPAGSSRSRRSRIVGTSGEVTSMTAPSRSTTTQGPRAGSRARPTQRPPSSSGCGSASFTTAAAAD